MSIGILDHVTKSFGDVVAISDVSFSIQEGSIMGFLGPNGSGKTTSIRLLLGLLKPQTGSVTLFGKKMLSTDIKNKIGYVPESDSFHSFLNAKDYLVAMGRLHMNPKDAIRRANEVLDELDLIEFANKKISTFSKGMKQRIKVGQALMHKPELIIADEPFNGLDPIIRKGLFELFQDYNKKNGTTFFISSHILFEVERLADQIVILYKGRTIAQGHPNKIRELIQEQPHSVSISSSEIKKLVHLLLDNKSTDNSVFSSITFPSILEKDIPTVQILTHQPKHFYSLVTDLAVDNNIIIKDMSSDEGLESLFRTLTVG